MEQMMKAVQWFMANYQAIVTAVAGLCASLTVLFAMIPGEQPEKALKAIVAFIEKFSKK